MSLVHTKNVQAIQIVTPIMFVKQVLSVYVYFLTLYSMPNATISVNMQVSVHWWIMDADDWTQCGGTSKTVSVCVNSGHSKSFVMGLPKAVITSRSLITQYHWLSWATHASSSAYCCYRKWRILCVNDFNWERYTMQCNHLYISYELQSGLHAWG